eukprot:TRINITY_DN7890_c0_g1_i5.p1 TRINITY_DN7890_c0_g1~~TRINITY_DN7890_c0_g1_i5.p1  ORF type:complete len:271 (+),score=50.00 TRINITY_DN7890_c0_g1_i5:65-877(+)
MCIRDSSQVVLNHKSLMSTFLSVLAVIISGLFLYTIGHFPTFEWPTIHGRFRVGFKDRIPAENIVCALYYPTDEPYLEDRDVFYAERSRWKNRVNATAALTGRLFLAPIFYIATHFYTRTRMGVILDASVASDARKSLIPVLISHGYGNDHLSMTVIAKELASQGYLVICVDHRNEWTKEVLAVKVRVQDDLIAYVKETVKKRPAELKIVSDTFTKTLAKRLSSDGPVQIDWSKTVGIGHSMGGDAIMRSSIGGLKFGACIALDLSLIHI